MSSAISIVALIFATASCALSLAVATRAKKILDPMVEGAMVPRSTIETGIKIPDVGALYDHEGNELDLRAGQEGNWILAVLSSSCSGCAQQTPDYKRLIATENIPATRAVTIVLGTGEDADEYARSVAQYSRVIRNQDNLDALLSAIGLKSYPAFAVVTTDGVVKYATPSVSALVASAKELVVV
ncbi:redoxin family protein [Streptomyces sp. NPDC090075]|uniref:redoxin family protein n=1 Tax=Streptomyces sp. NPDC090075 TaxID=3365937 RepID=UPI0037FC23A2